MDPKELLGLVRESWGWAIGVPVEIHGINSFGNVIIQSESGDFWRVSPEEPSFSRIGTALEFDSFRGTEAFAESWAMLRLVAAAQRRLGALMDGEAYCLKLPSILGGLYEERNLGKISLADLLRSSGDIAHQLDRLPDGSSIEIKIVD